MADAPWSVLNIEAYSCLKQAIARFLLDFENCNRVCEAHFNFWGPVPNQALRAIIQQIAADVVA